MGNSVPSALQRYRAKRHFARTPEPAGDARRSAQRLEFVVQRHHARRLHYDFRLEWDGVLKSWAIPKGPSLDPADKRLAVQVEDHPWEYREFSGEIPAGQYGAGHVAIWDRGHWSPEVEVDAALRDGKLDFTLHGERLRGRYSLVRLEGEPGGKSNWLLVKRRDEHASSRSQGPAVTELHPDPLPDDSAQADSPATRAPETARNPRRGRASSPAPATPEFLEPQLATPVDALPTGGNWITELKLDGYRILSHVDQASARCFSRSGHDWTHRMPRVAQALAGLGLRDSWLDGELIALDDRGVPQFQRLQQALDPGSGAEPVLMVFDALRLRGADLRRKPQSERKRVLQQALAGLPRGGVVRLVDFVDGQGAELREQACVQGFEGVILKDADAAYRSGRNRAWLKLKCRREQEFVVAGYTRTAAGRESLTALLLGYYDDAGRLRFAGRAGTGFSERELGGLRRRLDALAVERPAFVTPPRLRGAERPRWVRPEIVAQVRFAEWTESGLLRQPLFLGIREDVAAAHVRREPDRLFDPGQPPRKPTRNTAPDAGTKAPVKKTTKSAVKSAPRVAPKNRRPAGASGTPAREPASRSGTPQLTNPQRVLYPEDGVTKAQLAGYYEAIAPVLWPHLRGRPLSLIRATSGQGRVFFQRHLDGKSVPGLKPVTIAGSEEKPYFVCSSLAGIPLLAQMGAVELHTWGSRMPRADRADRMTFDLDPDPTLPWPKVREAATLVREMLAELGLQALLKTSGGMGLHVVVPLTKGPPFEVAAAFSRRVAEHLARLVPQRFSARRGAANRQGKVYVDWQRNQFAATTVAAYSPRHRPGVPVSLPLDWDELGRRDLRGACFNLRNVVARVAERGDAWADHAPIRQSLTQRVIDRLEAAAT